MLIKHPGYVLIQYFLLPDRSLVLEGMQLLADKDFLYVTRSVTCFKILQLLLDILNQLFEQALRENLTCAFIESEESGLLIL